MTDEYAFESEKWELLVGGFILAFGDIELISIELWREHFEADPPREFSSRVNKIIGKLKTLGPSRNELIELLQQASRLSKKRNTLAHNPMQVEVYEHRKSGQMLLKGGIRALFGDDFIDDLELEELAAEAKMLSSKFYIAIGYDFSASAI